MKEIPEYKKLFDEISAENKGEVKVIGRVLPEGESPSVKVIGRVVEDNGLEPNKNTFGSYNNVSGDSDNVKTTLNNKDGRSAFSNSKSGLANDSLISYNGELRDLIEERGNIIVDSHGKLTDIVNLAFDQPDTKATVYFGIIDVSTLQKIENSVPNIPKDMNGKLFKKNNNYSVAATLDSIRHLVDDKKLSRDEVIDYLDRLADTIVEFDSVTFDYYYKGQNKTPGLTFKKTFNDGTMLSFDLISNKKRSISLQTLYLDSAAYQKKKAAETPPMQKTSAHTPEARVGQPSNNNITDSAEKVNSETKFSYKAPAESKVYKQIAEWERKP